MVGSVCGVWCCCAWGSPTRDLDHAAGQKEFQGVVLVSAGASDKKEAPREEGIDMLVLSRKKNESIVINNDITIVVVEIRGDKVRLGVEAPKEIPVHRREVYDAIRRNDVTVGDKAETDSKGTSGEA